MASKRKDGLIQRQVTINGKRVVFYGKTERELNRKIAEYKEERKDGRLFKVVAEEWEEKHFPTLAPNTLKGYRPALKRAIDEFGDKHTGHISAKMIDNYIIRFAARGMAQKTVRTQLLVINLIMTHAVVEGDLEYNPAAYISIPKGLPKARRELPSDNDIETVKKSLDCTFGLFAFFILYTGCRRGEALALTYGDIDFKNRWISITKSLYHENNAPHLKMPKTEAGERQIILLDILYKILPKRRPSTELIFPNERGELMTETQFQRQWELYTEETGVTATPHQFRHAFATILFEAGLDDKDAQELLGHANLATTRDIYTHITHSRMESTALKLNEAVNKSVASQ